MADREELRAAAESRVGQTIDGKYRLVRLLGVGGMAAVYEAEHRNRKRVALKMLHASLSGSERQRKRFAREAYVANTIGHPGVVQIHDDGVASDGTAYLVMELLEGESVGTLQRHTAGPLALDAVLDIADQLLDVLIAAHEKGVIHRDIKPDNLFVTRRGELKVLDFGIARLFEHLPGATVETQAGVMLGTPAFMAQEQARGRWDEVDHRSDLWAVGATMFTLLSGEHVHAAETPQEQLGRAMTVPARSLSTFAPDLSPDFLQIVDRALRFERSERWPDARAMQQALQVYRGQRTTLPDAPLGALRAAVTTVGDTLALLPSSEHGVEIAPAKTHPGVLRGVRYAAVVLALGFIALMIVTFMHPSVARKTAAPPEMNVAAGPGTSALLGAGKVEPIQVAAPAAAAAAAAPPPLAAAAEPAEPPVLANDKLAPVDSMSRKPAARAPYAKTTPARRVPAQGAVGLPPDPLDRRR